MAVGSGSGRETSGWWIWREAAQAPPAETVLEHERPYQAPNASISSRGRVASAFPVPRGSQVRATPASRPLKICCNSIKLLPTAMYP